MNTELPSRSGDSILDFIAEYKLRFVWVKAMLPESKESTLGEDTLLILSSEDIELYSGRYFADEFDRSTILREGVEFIMDQEEL
jgi:hypothetical protein